MDSAKLKTLGFQFEFEHLGLALNDLLSLNRDDEESTKMALSVSTDAIPSRTLSEPLLWNVLSAKTLVVIGLSVCAVAGGWRIFSNRTSGSSFGAASGEKIYIGDLMSGLLASKSMR